MRLSLALRLAIFLAALGSFNVCDTLLPIVRLSRVPLPESPILYLSSNDRSKPPCMEHERCRRTRLFGFRHFRTGRQVIRITVVN